MAENDYVGTVRRTMTVAVEEATRRGASDVEAEHLLLAIVRDGGPVAEIFAGAGIDYARVEALLRAEREHALAAVGVAIPDAEVLTASPRTGRPGWGASAKEAITRGAKLGHRDRQRVRESDLALGILLAELGTVPRALALGGVDREALLGRIQRQAQSRRKD